MGDKLKRAGVGIGIVLLLILGIPLDIGVGVLAFFMFVWNITDITNVGPNFWNVTWLVIATGLSLLVVCGWVRMFSK